MKQLRLEVIFGSKNNTLSPALRAILGSSNAATKALKKTRDEIRKLNEQQKKIDGYQKQKKAVQDQGKALQDLQNHIKNLRQQMKTNPSAELTRDFDKAVAKARKLKQEYERNRIELQRMRTEMNNAGLSTNRLSEHQQRLRNDLNRANQSMREQEQRLQRMTQMQQNYERHAGRLRAAAGYGMGAAMTGAGALYTMRKPIEESKRTDVEEHRIASLGLGKKATEEAILYAKAMKTYGTSTLENLTLVRDGITAFGDVHHAEMVAPTLAKMKFANEAMFGSEGGAENEKKFMDMLKVIELRGGLKSEKAFNDQANIIQQVITATGGRVQGEEWLNVIKTGGIAAKGIDNKAFYYKMEPLVQEMGGFRVGTAMMSAYQNLYQGRTTQRAMGNLDKFGLIGDPSKVKHNKTGDLSYLDIGAIKGADLFKKDQFAWMEQVLVPALNAKGITKEGDVVDAIGSIFSNRTASNLFAQMYQQRDQIHKNAKLNEGANNIDQLYVQGKDTTTGKELEAKAKLHDAYLKFGTTILPIYTKAIEVATSALANFTGWMEKNPTLAKALGAGLVFIAVSLVAIGGALAIFSPLILGMLSLRLVLASTSTAAGLFSRVFAAAPVVLNVLKSALMGVGRVFLFLGRALLMNPIGLAITAIAVAAYLIYKNWTPIRAFFINLWNGIKNAFNTFSNWLTNSWNKITSTVSNTAVSVWDGVKNAFNTGISFIKGIIQSIDQTFADNPILNVLMPFIGIPRMIIANWSSISAFFTTFWNTVASIFNTYLATVTNFIMAGFDTAKNYLIGVWTEITAFFSNIWTEISTVFNASVTWVSNIISTGFNVVSGYVSSIWNTIKSVISVAWQAICALFTAISPLPYITSAFNSVFDWLGGLYNRMMSLGSNIIQGLIDGIKSGFEKLKSLWATINGWMPDFMRKTMDIHSPSRVMAGLGGHIMSGLHGGIEKAFPNLKAKFADVVSIFKPDSELLQKINVAPALGKINPAPLSSGSVSSGNYTIEGDTITININAAPGQNIQQIQSMLENMLNKREREKMARVRSSFKDQE
ncbi:MULTISPECIES: phage tail tape measure protein [Acinetobacter]|uniref:phage tail tape measure protein n=1 Tax=Acinetobacter TaxID=469 RepID=UPI000BDE91DE|nr:MULTISPECIES: phage tail tape measure protein [Acinetobacter]